MPVLVLGPNHFDTLPLPHPFLPSFNDLPLIDFLIQRAIQQQLYYSAQMRNEPMVDWLKRFGNHEHLDSKIRREGNCGFPGTYSATFDQLKTTPFTSYLSALGTEPDSSIEVRVIKPMRRLSARERANPYLNKEVNETSTRRHMRDDVSNSLKMQPLSLLTTLATLRSLRSRYTTNPL